MHILESIPIIYFGNIFSANIFLSVVNEKLSIHVSVQIYSLYNIKFCTLITMINITGKS